MIIKIPNTKWMAKEDNGNLGPGIGQAQNVAGLN
jgi:hypothetical protein